MLILSRKAQQQILINHRGEVIAVTVAKMVGNRVSIGVDAPKDARIVRGELADKQWPLPGTNSEGGQDAA